jgi:hypothetical protein
VYAYNWSLKSGLHTSKAGTLPVEPYLKSVFALVILEMGSCKLLAQALLKPPISASQVARIIGVSHQAPHQVEFLISSTLNFYQGFTANAQCLKNVQILEIFSG